VELDVDVLVDDVVLRLVDVELDVDVLVDDVVLRLVDVELDVDVLVDDDVVWLVDVDVLLVVVVVGATGAVTVRLYLPFAPFRPSTTMKYVVPAVTVGVTDEAMPQASLLQATWVPVVQVVERT
jgi:hypothetical protein